jgi:hypothetical protein
MSMDCISFQINTEKPGAAGAIPFSRPTRPCHDASPSGQIRFYTKEDGILTRGAFFVSNAYDFIMAFSRFPNRFCQAFDFIAPVAHGTVFALYAAYAPGFPYILRRLPAGLLRPHR